MVPLVLISITFKGVIAEIPHDAGALIAYLLLLAFVAFIWIGSRAKPAAETRTGPESEKPLG
jgi:hypothetical protein